MQSWAMQKDKETESDPFDAGWLSKPIEDTCGAHWEHDKNRRVVLHTWPDEFRRLSIKLSGRVLPEFRQYEHEAECDWHQSSDYKGE